MIHTFDKPVVKILSPPDSGFTREGRCSRGNVIPSVNWNTSRNSSRIPHVFKLRNIQVVITHLNIWYQPWWEESSFSSKKEKKQIKTKKGGLNGLRLELLKRLTLGSWFASKGNEAWQGFEGSISSSNSLFSCEISSLSRKSFLGISPNLSLETCLWLLRNWDFRPDSRVLFVWNSGVSEQKLPSELLGIWEEKLEFPDWYEYCGNPICVSVA